MELTAVTLDEVFSAASARAASLVPETSGYLALAVADASARLPFRLDEHMVTLTTEGTVKVARGTAVVAPEESAARIRSMLGTLLGCSAGSMPALTATSRPRAESPEGVERFIRELEAALVPVNRAAARRALARLARETVRARDLGRLKRRRRPRESDAPSGIRAPAPAAAPPQLEHHASELLARVPSHDVVFTPPPPPAPEPAFARPTPTPTPDEPATVIDAPVAEVDALVAEALAAAAPVVASRSRGETRHRASASLGASRRSDVEDLLDRFVVSTLASPEGLRAARASLKRLAELDPTPPPPAAAEIRRITESLETAGRIRAPQGAARSRRDLLLTPTREGHGHSSGRAGLVAAAVLALVVAGLLGHYLPRLLAGTPLPDHALTSAPSR